MHRLIPSWRPFPFRAGLLALAVHLGCGGVARASALGADEFDWGPFASRLEDVHGDLRLRAAGPLLEKAVSPRGDTLHAVRPFHVRAQDVATSRTHYEWVWPLCVAKSYKDEFSWRVLTAMYLDWDRNDPQSRYRFWLVPLWFQGRSVAGNRYAALFPLYGELREFLGQDEIRFVLWPLWVRTSINDVKSRHVLWPVFAHTSGDGIHRFRVFPFYGYSRQRDRFEKRFILWPIWTSAVYKFPTSEGKGYLLFPLYGRVRLTDESTVFVAPPFFRFSRGSRGRSVHAPWPFVQYKSGADRRLYIFPFWGRRTLAGNDRTHYLWPIARRYRVDQGGEVLRGLKVLPFLTVESTHSQPTAPGARPVTRSRDVVLWPLGSYRSEGGVTRWRALELWPLRDMGPVERGYAPFWTLASRTWTDQAADTEILWGLYRQRRRGEDRYVSLFPLFDVSRDAAGRFEINLLKGLVGYHREEGAKSARILYFLRLGSSGGTQP